MSDCSTHAFDAPLKPCPFCGGEAELTGFNAPEYWVWCPSCKASTDAHTGKENAIAAWNTRAERTCEVVKGKCSNCGKDLPEDPYSDYEGNYCPSCGCKVVG